LFSLTGRGGRKKERKKKKTTGYGRRREGNVRAGIRNGTAFPGERMVCGNVEKERRMKGWEGGGLRYFDPGEN